GYDPKDPLTVFSIGRKPVKPYPSFAKEKSLQGLRIGVVREYMDKKLFTNADSETIDIVERATDDLRKLGATVVDPGPGGALFTSCIRKYAPAIDNKLFTKRFPDKFPLDKEGKPVGDHITTLLDMTMDPSLVPDKVTLRDFAQAQAAGEGKFMMNRYLRERGDSEIRSNTDLINKATFYNDAHFPDRKKARQTADEAMELDLSERMLRRFAVQQIMLQCMEEQHLDAITYPTTNVPPPKLDAPQEPTLNGRSPLGWTLLGAQGFPAITVPAGFTTQVYDRVRDPNAPLPPAPEGGNRGGTPPERTRLVGPVAAQLPVGI
ncbi:MAG: amidase, partial [Solimonas sp.]